jgi:uncharacterized protein (TIGR02646 family)
MRRVKRMKLDHDVQKNLNDRQCAANKKHKQGTLDATKVWKYARDTLPLKHVLATLKSMMGPRERCMYCLDSHGSDIEHFWPKTPYPKRMFRWSNMLLCCTECGRMKGDQFPLEANQPLLIDPTIEEPWIHLDFDPDTGNVVARFDSASNTEAPKGRTTVDVLQLDRREALATGYLRTFKRLSGVVERHLQKGVGSAVELIAELRNDDEHGLIGWCFLGTGHSVPPFRELHQHHLTLWIECVAIVQQQ